MGWEKEGDFAFFSYSSSFSFSNVRRDLEDTYPRSCVSFKSTTPVICSFRGKEREVLPIITKPSSRSSAQNSR